MPDLQDTLKNPVSDTQTARKFTIPKDCTVLVVEDNVSNFVLIARLLGYLGVHCEWKTSGYEVVEFADTLPRLDLILMDIQMPGMDGLEAIRRIRAEPDPCVARVPIIALSGLAMASDREKCLQAGANAHLSKPVGLQKLTQVMQAVMAQASPSS